MEIGEQSSLNLVLSIGTNLGGGFEPFGTSDERFTVVGGSVRIIEGLLGLMADRVQSGHQLVALRSQGAGYVLTFLTPSGPTVEVPAEIVILALPFSILRQVEIQVPLPAIKRQAIDQLGYPMFGVAQRNPLRGKGRIFD
jgi:monoamine oxidase